MLSPITTDYSIGHAGTRTSSPQNANDERRSHESNNSQLQQGHEFICRSTKHGEAELEHREAEHEHPSIDSSQFISHADTSIVNSFGMLNLVCEIKP